MEKKSQREHKTNGYIYGPSKYSQTCTNLPVITRQLSFAKAYIFCEEILGFPNRENKGIPEKYLLLLHCLQAKVCIVKVTVFPVVIIMDVRVEP